MDERQPQLQTGPTPSPGEEREVVLRYDAPYPQPVTERYVQPFPLPGGARVSPPPPPPPPSAPEGIPEPPRSKGRGLRIFLGCLGVLLISVNVLMILRAERALRQRSASPSVREGQYEWRGTYNPYSDAETTIARYPNGDGTRLSFAEPGGETLSIQAIYERVNPCTVTVATAMPDGTAVIGTGVIFTENGYILTNAHVVAGGAECFVVLDTGRSFDGVRLVGYDTGKDLAVIKVAADHLPTAEFGDSDLLTVGDPVYAIGNPLGVQLRGTLTDGIVSAINRDVTVDGIKMSLIQTNAALNNGNSGGPLINAYGQVVGINTMKIGSSSAVSVEGLGFAIPTGSAAWMVDDLIEYGELRGEPVLGITVFAVPLSDGEPALQIYSVQEESGAAEAGLLPGDRVVRADGEGLETVHDLLRVRRRLRAGESLTLEIDRNGTRFPVDVVLKEDLP